MTVILLAAGLSTRMGCNKLLLPFRGKPLIISTLEATIAAADRVIVVTGHERLKIENAIREYNVEIVFAEDYSKGQKYSALRGIREVKDDDFAIIPGDLPLILPEDFRGTEKLLQSHSIARASFHSIPGHPVMYRQEHKERLLAHSGTMKEYLEANDTAFYEGSEGTILDADTKEAYRELLQRNPLPNSFLQ